MRSGCNMRWLAICYTAETNKNYLAEAESVEPFLGACPLLAEDSRGIIEGILRSCLSPQR